MDLVHLGFATAVSAPNIRRPTVQADERELECWTRPADRSVSSFSTRCTSTRQPCQKAHQRLPGNNVPCVIASTASQRPPFCGFPARDANRPVPRDAPCHAGQTTKASYHVGRPPSPASRSPATWIAIRRSITRDADPTIRLRCFVLKRAPFVRRRIPDGESGVGRRKQERGRGLDLTTLPQDDRHYRGPAKWHRTLTLCFSPGIVSTSPPAL